MRINEKIARALARDTLTAKGREEFDNSEAYFRECFAPVEQDKFMNQANIALGVVATVLVDAAVVR